MSFLPSGSNPETSSFTCNTCNIRFIDAEFQRQHMKTDWHRYNLKRRVAQLPSITSDVFAEKVLCKDINPNENNENEDEHGFCVAKRKKKNNSKRILPHSGQLSQDSRGRFRMRQSAATVATSEMKDYRERSASPAHSVSSELSQFSLNEIPHGFVELESVHTGSELDYVESSDFRDLDSDEEEISAVASNDMGEEEEVEVEEEGEEGEDDAQAISITSCFYCGANNYEIENNIKHMFKRHGLYIPERSYLVNVEGLLVFLRDMVSNHKCLVCDFQGRNIESLRQHIYGKGHCKIPYETKEQKLAICEFYNFDIGSKEPSRRVRGGGDGKGKGVSFKEELTSSEEITEIDKNSSAELDSANDLRNGITNNYTSVQIDPSGVELTTPVGSRIGHRSMQRYYRQNIALSVVLNEEGRRTQALVDRRFAPGLSMKQTTKQEKEVRRLEHKLENEYTRKMKNKKINYQRYFRDEILGT
ncbi:REH1 [Candida oxycetoniae]|uniref:REH1 n=1 Tax=Candida oxycetoniae TaxID=497107 RepID=A0AAI9SS94_9ASCO|nr:REH1 [Candida oxycetoniae]KAI3402325.2 REH1 [Candida oxycetoniae]